MLRLSQRPLTASSLDRGLFVDRDAELAAAERGLELGLNVAVVGPAGSGRTSLLHQLRGRLSRPAIYVEGRAWDSARDLLLAVRSGLGDERRFEPRYEAGESRVLRQIGMERVAATPPALTEEEVEALARAAAEQESHERAEVVFIDDPTPRAARMLFGAFRDTLWSVELLWVVSVRDDARAAVLAPPADAFFGTTIDLGELDAVRAAELLRRRAQAGGGPNAQRLERLVERIVDHVPNRQPRTLLELAAAVLQSERPDTLFRTWAAAQQVAAGLGRTEAMVFEELRGLGPVHAGDDRLLRRMGVTRSRIAQVLQRLEREGLVVSHAEGRRVMYRVAIPTETTRGAVE